MLSRKSVNCIKGMILFGKRTLTMPYDWNHTTNAVTMGSLKQKVVQNLCMLYLYLEAVYQAWVLYAEFGRDDMPFESYMKLISHFFTRLIGTIFTSLTFSNAWRKKYFINQIFYLDQRLQVYENQGQGKRDPCERVLRFGMTFIMLQPLIVAFTYVGENTDKRYWHGALLPSAIQPLFIPLFFVVEYWISVVALSGAIVTSMFLICYFGSAPRWIRLLIDKETEINEYVDEHDTYIYYRAQQILNEVYNNSYSCIWCFAMICVLSEMVVGIVCTIRVTPSAQLPGGLIFPLGLLAVTLVVKKVFDPAADVTGASQDFIAHHRACGRMDNRKRLRSLRPLKMKSWIFFSMSKSTTLNFLNQVVDYSVSVLLMT